MKLKYQMRGLGIGMIVTALLMGVAGERGIPLSDAEIKAKALALGMVERDSLKLTDISNDSPTPSETSNNPPIPSETLAPIQDTVPEGEPNGGIPIPQEPEEREDTPEASAEKPEENQGTEGQPGNPAESPEADSLRGSEQTPESGDMVTVVIEAGVTSYRICIMLAEMGLVEDAEEFDTYLCDNGYSRKIDYGTYEIPMGASEEEIAKIITRNR